MRHEAQVTSDESRVTKRVMSIDALRGFDMFWITGGGAVFASLDKIFNCPATKFINKQLQHAVWEGFTFEDIIMPLFLFICGVAMPYSFTKRIEHGDSKLKLYRHVIIRVLILWVLGMIKQGNLLQFDLSTLRLYSNTLQAIAAGYLIATILLIEFKLLWQIVLTAGLLIGYWLLMTFINVPGHGAGVLTEQGNLAIYLDKLILGRFEDGTSYSWILSSLGFGATTMIGVFAGKWLRSNRKDLTKAVVLLAAGGVSIVLGLLWSPVFPIIKHIWTSSFVLYSGGFCLLLMGLFYLIIDVWQFRKWTYVFVVIGANAIFAYMSNTFIPFGWISGCFVGGLVKHLGNWDTLVHTTATFAVFWLLLRYMYRKKTFIKI